MPVTQRLELRQGQSLVMTPQLQQAIKLLQLSNIELTAFVEEELERNPLLERDETSDSPAETGENRDALQAAGEAPEQTLDQTLAQDDIGNADELDAEREDVFAQDAQATAAPLADRT